MEFCLSNCQWYLEKGQVQPAKKYEYKADIMRNKEFLNPESLLDICRIIYNTSLTLNEKFPGYHDSIIYFLTKAQHYMELNLTDLKINVDYDNIRYSILLLLANSLIDQDTHMWDPSRCDSLLNTLQDEYPTKIEPFTLRIIFCKKKNSVRLIEDLEEIIIKMITTIDIIANFDALTGIINEFATMSTESATGCLDYIFTKKLEPKKHHKWLEKIFVFRFLLTTQSRIMTNTEIINSLDKYCGQAERCLIDTISKHTASTVVTLLWNSGKKSDKTGQYTESIGFYKLGLKGLISHNHPDRAKIQRALMLAYINVANYEQCEKLYRSMNPRDSNSPLTQLLLLQNFIKQADKGSCLECLRKIKSAEDQNSIDALLLAAAECKASEALAIEAISLLFEALESKKVSSQELDSYSVPTLCLLRYILQLNLKIIDSDQKEVFSHHLPTVRTLLRRAIEYLNKIKILVKVTESVEKDSRLRDIASINEIEWFASTSYNIAIKCRDENEDNSNALGFAHLSCQFIQLIPYQDFEFPKMFHHVYWGLKSQILHLTMLKIADAKENINTLRQVQSESSNLINEIWQKKENQTFKDKCSLEQKKRLDECFIDALTLSYEASLQLRDKTNISHILVMTGKLQDSEIESLLVDLASSMHELPRSLLVEIIERLIERNVNSTVVGDCTLCYWIRSFLDCALILGRASRLDLTEQILGRMKANLKAKLFESDELSQEIQMIAILTWNQGVSSIIKEEKTLGMAWCHTSIQFASMVSDSLESQLKELWVALSQSAQL